MTPGKHSKTASFIQGRFSPEDARALLTALYGVKIAFHEEKIRRNAHCENELRHSTHRILQLKESLDRALREIAAADGPVDLFSSIWVARVEA